MLECLKLSGGRSGKTEKKVIIRGTDPLSLIAHIPSAQVLIEEVQHMLLDRLPVYNGADAEGVATVGQRNKGNRDSSAHGGIIECCGVGIGNGRVGGPVDDDQRRVASADGTFVAIHRAPEIDESPRADSRAVWAVGSEKRGDCSG